MKTRMDLQKLLEETIGKRKDGVQNVYFQPPENLKMVYPCIRYSRDTINNEFADNIVYEQTNIRILIYLGEYHNYQCAHMIDISNQIILIMMCLPYVFKN